MSHLKLSGQYVYHKNHLFSYPMYSDWSSYWMRTLFSLMYEFFKYTEH